jgi:hypothetical protein
LLNSWFFSGTGVYYLWRLCRAGLRPDLHRRLCRRPSAGHQTHAGSGAVVLALGYFMTGMSLLKPDLIFIALGPLPSVTGCLKPTRQPAVKMLSPKMPVWTAHSPCFICRLISVRCCRSRWRR